MKRTKTLPENKFFQNTVLVYVLLLAAIFPLFCPSMYFHIQEDHLSFFTVVTLGLLALFLISLLVYYYQVTGQYEIGLGEKIQKGIKNLSITDYAFFALLLSAIISTCFSSYPQQSFTGESGRFMGLSTYLLLFITYFLVSRGFKFKEFVIVALLVAADLISIMAVLQRSGCDVLGFYQNIEAGMQLQFISTIGNIDFFSSYIMIVLPISSGLFCFYNSRLKWFYLVSAFLSFSALLVANADSGFVAVAFMFVVMGLFSFKNLKTFKNFITVVLTFFVSCKIIYLLIRLNSSAFAALKAIPHFLLTSNVTLICICITALLLALLYYFDRKCYQFQKPLKILQRVFVSIVSLIAAGVIFLFVCFSCIDTTKQLGSLQNYLRFNNQWGDNRGYIFSLAFDSFIKFNPFQKLFGYGMDMFKTAITNLLNFQPSKLSQNQMYDSAHNELLNSLVSIGLVGCTAYVVFVISQIVKNIKSHKQEPLLLVFAICLSCYFVQGFANIAVPMVFPFFILLIAISESVNRQMALKAAMDATALTGMTAREVQMQNDSSVNQRTKKAKRVSGKTRR
jgi:hypothetical protein